MKDRLKIMGYALIATLIIGIAIVVLVFQKSAIAGYIWGAELGFIMIDGQMYEMDYKNSYKLSKKDKGMSIGRLMDRDDKLTSWTAYKVKGHKDCIIAQNLRETKYYKIVKDENNTDGYQIIMQNEAHSYMKQVKDCIILDVRTKEEYDEKHIKNAICIPNEDINDTELKELPDKDQLILVYCRSGNRSKQAAKKLAAIGYTNVKEFGGINEWDYETE